MENNLMKKPIIKKWWFWAIVAVVILALASGGDKDQDATANTNSQQETIQLSEAKTEETQKDNQEAIKTAYKEFYLQIKDYTGRLDQLHELVIEAEQLLISGKGTKLDMYSFLDTSEKTASNIWTATEKMEIPKILSQDHQKLLKAAKSDSAMFAFMRKEAYKSYKVYLDKNSLEAANEFKRQITSSNSYYTKAVVVLDQILEELEVEIESEA